MLPDFCPVGTLVTSEAFPLTEVNVALEKPASEVNEKVTSIVAPVSTVRAEIGAFTVGNAAGSSFSHDVASMSVKAGKKNSFIKFFIIFIIGFYDLNLMQSYFADVTKLLTGN
jgi:hypothetical protein